MTTHLAVDDRLIEEACRIGRHKTRKGAVTAALRAYVERLRQREIVDLFGTIDFDPAWDHKVARRLRPK